MKHFEFARFIEAEDERMLAVLDKVVDGEASFGGNSQVKAVNATNFDVKLNRNRGHFFMRMDKRSFVEVIENVISKKEYNAKDITRLRFLSKRENREIQ